MNLKAAAGRSNTISIKKAEPEAKPVSPGKRIGVITHFFPNVSAAIIKINQGKIAVGESIHFKGAVTDFKISIKSMQMNRAPIEIAGKGQEIGIQVPDRVREGDEVFKLTPKKKAAPRRPAGTSRAKP